MPSLAIVYSDLTCGRSLRWDGVCFLLSLSIVAICVAYRLAIMWAIKKALGV